MEFTVFDYHLLTDRKKVLLYYKGPFDELVLSKISYYLREQFPESPKAGKKLFAVFIELAQNIAYYSSEMNLFGNELSKHGVGTILIKENENAYTLTAGNLVRNEGEDPSAGRRSVIQQPRS